MLRIDVCCYISADAVTYPATSPFPARHRRPFRYPRLQAWAIIRACPSRSETRLVAKADRMTAGAQALPAAKLAPYPGNVLLRCALIGYGAWGAHHAPVISHNPEAQ